LCHGHMRKAERGNNDSHARATTVSVFPSPRFRFVPQPPKFPGQFPAALFDISIDALAIGLKIAVFTFRAGSKRPPGGTPDIDQPHEVIEIDTVLATELAG